MPTPETTTQDLHPAQATHAAVTQGKAEARAEAIRLVEQAHADAAEEAPPDAPETTPDATSNEPEPEPSKPEAPESSEEKPADERVARRIAAAKRLEQRSARERGEIQAARAQLEQERAALAEQRKAHEAALAQYKLLEDDPVKAFETLGLDPKVFLDRLAGEHNPASVVARELSEMKRQLAEEREARLRLTQETARREQEARFQAAQQASTKAFVDHVADNAERYPYLTDEFTAEEIAAHGWDVATRHAEQYKKQFGEYPDDSVIAEYLEAQAKSRADQRSAWKARLKKPSEPGQGTASATALKPRTLTNSAVSQKASPPRHMSDRDAREEAMKIIQTMHAKGA